MPEDTGGERNIPATPHKRAKAWMEGNVARSQDLNTAFSLVAALLGFYFLGSWMTRQILVAGHYFLAEIPALLPDPSAPRYALTVMFAHAAACAIPFMLVMMLAGFLSNLLQVGFLWTTRPLVPNLSRINPITGFQRFFTLRNLVELGKSLAKLAIVGTIAWLALRDRLPDLIQTALLDPGSMGMAIAGMISAVWVRVAIAMVVLGILDYGYQKWQWEQDMRMTQQELKEELREFEGDPHVKGRIRKLQRRFATQRMLREVPKADVVVTNPTHYAIALRYAPDSMAAPQVIAKGARLLAEQIRDIAARHRVPIVQRPELARALYRDVEVGQYIPEKLFTAVAEVLSFVYQIDTREEKRQEREALMSGLVAPATSTTRTTRSKTAARSLAAVSPFAESELEQRHYKPELFS